MATAAAKRYARAVFELAGGEREIDEWTRRLSELRDLLSDEKVAAVLTNPTIPSEQRMDLIASASRDPEATNLAKLLIEANRVDEIGAIADEFQDLADDAAGRVRATVTTAVELGARDRDRVAVELSQRLGKTVTMRVEVDPRILGGLKVQYGDRLIDASVATRLQQLRRRLTEAS
ncbi:MAG TPA: F0F1 ATP synthase subunit delta [Candidatus Dormibacteraeota bacterium]|nr:F0F1 ATP synthase subunit delta [Candidatus Dormibacteraeota bacterium]